MTYPCITPLDLPDMLVAITRDGFFAEADDLLTGRSEPITPEADAGDAFDIYALACTLLDTR